MLLGLVLLYVGAVLFINGISLLGKISMSEAARAMIQRNLSVWMFPEGTRSRGKPLQPFKKGAFHLAVQAQRPIIPIAVSSYHKTINLNAWKPGTVILEVLPPIRTVGKTEQDIESLISEVHTLMKSKIDGLDRELTA